MNIGSLYQVIWGYWLLFPTKEIISAISEVEDAQDIFSTHALGAADYAAWYSRKYNCNVSWFDSLVVCLEENGEFKKLLTSKGLIGWTQLGESYNKYFVEVKTVEQQTAAITRIPLVG